MPAPPPRWLNDPEAAVVWRGPMVSGAIRQFYIDMNWGDLDYLLVDLPPGTSDAPMTVMQQLPTDGAIIVSTPQGLATMAVSKAIQLMSSRYPCRPAQNGARRPGSYSCATR